MKIIIKLIKNIIINIIIICCYINIVHAKSINYNNNFDQYNTEKNHNLIKLKKLYVHSNEQNIINIKKKLKNNIYLNKNILNISRLYKDMLYILYKNGNIKSHITIQWIINYKEKKIYIFLNIKNNKKYIINKIKILGNIKTNKNLILEKIELNKNKILTSNELKKIKKNLNKLNYFDKNYIFFKKNNILPKNILYIIIKEKKTGSVNLGLNLKKRQKIFQSIKFYQNNFDYKNYKKIFQGNGQKLKIISTHNNIENKKYFIFENELLKKKILYGINVILKNNKNIQKEIYYKKFLNKNITLIYSLKNNMIKKIINQNIKNKIQSLILNINTIKTNFFEIPNKGTNFNIIVSYLYKNINIYISLKKWIFFKNKNTKILLKNNIGYLIIKMQKIKIYFDQHIEYFFYTYKNYILSCFMNLTKINNLETINIGISNKILIYKKHFYYLNVIFPITNTQFQGKNNVKINIGIKNQF